MIGGTGASRAHPVEVLEKLEKLETAEKKCLVIAIAMAMAPYLIRGHSRVPTLAATPSLVS
jgi:hypothetical protein